jgi:hypothetical protein
MVPIGAPDMEDAMLNCMRCDKETHVKRATVSAYKGDPAPVQAKLCVDCMEKAVDGGAVLVIE